MGVRTVTETFDDLDGKAGEDVTERTFTLDGIRYRVDLSERNWQALCRSMKRYVDAATRVGGHTNGHVHVGKLNPPATTRAANYLDSEERIECKAWLESVGRADEWPIRGWPKTSVVQDWRDYKRLIATPPGLVHTTETGK